MTCALSNHRICEAAKTNGLLEQELAHAVNAASHAINKTHPKFPEVSFQHESHNILSPSVQFCLKKKKKITSLPLEVIISEF